MDRNNIHVTMWYRDPLEPRGPGDITRPQDKAYGIAFNINQMANDNMMWFLRGGLGTGGFAEINLTGGLGYRPNSRTGDLLGVGVGWSKPDDAQIPIPLPFNPRDQLTAEVFYRLAITPNIAITQLAREFDTIRESIPPAIEQAQAFVERIGLGGAASNLLEEGGSDLSGYAARAGSYVLTAGNGLAYRGWPERVR